MLLRVYVLQRACSWLSLVHMWQLIVMLIFFCGRWRGAGNVTACIAALSRQLLVSDRRGVNDVNVAPPPQCKK